MTNMAQETGRMRRRRPDKLNNRGMTLVELLVAIALIALVATVSLFGIGLLASGDSKKASRSIQDMLNEVRTSTLSIEADWCMKLRRVDDEYEIAIYQDGDEDDFMELGSRIDITFDGRNIDEGYELTFTYNKSSGTVKDIVYAPVGSLSGESVKGDDKNSMVISVDSSTKGDYTITLYYDTGKVSGQI